MKNKSYPFVQQNASLFSTPPQPHLSREYRTVYYAVQGGSNLLSQWMKSYGVTIHMKATEQYFPVVLFQVVLTFESVDEIL